MIPGRTAALDLQLVDRGTRSFEHGERIRLGIEYANRTSIACPVTARAFELRRTPAHPRGNPALCLRRIAFIGAGDFEQCEIVEAAIGVALGCGKQARQQRRAHVGHVGRDRIGKLQLAADRRQMPSPTLRR